MISAGSARMPLTGVSLKLKSLDPINSDPDEEEEEEECCCYCCAAAQYESCYFSYACDQSIGSENWCAITSWVEFS